MLPEPALAFTLPSLHDGTILDCRIYHPLSLTANPRAPAWHRHAAIIAHPYAPLGGSYDDPVVETVAALLLRRGFCVCTFNFRGAGGSAGKTSWTSRAEREDYATVVGFVVHYVHYLDPFKRMDQGPYQAKDAEAAPSEDAPERPVLLLGGYSYGAIITTHLPPLGAILQSFLSPDLDSHAGQVRLRAQHLADQENLVLGSARAAMLEHHNQHIPRSSSKRGVRIGGDEGGSPRKSHESHGRRSFSLDAEDKIRRGVHDLVAKARSGRHGHRPSTATAGTKMEVEVEKPSEGPMDRILDLIRPQPAYLLVSAPQGLATHLATLSLIPSAWSKNKSPVDLAAEEKLIRNPTLAVYGDADSFTPAAKLRTWKTKMEGRDGSLFRGVEVATGGHFWVEEGVLERLKGAVGEFAGKLLES